MARGPLQGDECATCGLLYERFRDVSVSFVEAYQEVFAESVEACAAGNYARPASRRAVLGRMHEYKIKAWKAHRDRCAEAADAYEVPF